jgi:hypothetical protein
MKRQGNVIVVKDMKEEHVKEVCHHFPSSSSPSFFPVTLSFLLVQSLVPRSTVARVQVMVAA